MNSKVWIASSTFAGCCGFCQRLCTATDCLRAGLPHSTGVCSSATLSSPVPTRPATSRAGAHRGTKSAGGAYGRLADSGRCPSLRAGTNAATPTGCAGATASCRGALGTPASLRSRSFRLRRVPYYAGRRATGPGTGDGYGSVADSGSAPPQRRLGGRSLGEAGHGYVWIGGGWR